MSQPLPAIPDPIGAVPANTADYIPPSLAEQVANDYIWSFENPSTRTSWAVTQHVGDRKSGPLFCSKRTPGKRMTRGDVQGVVKRYAKWVGIVQSVSPHSYRHTFVTQSRNAGIPDRDIQSATGHADLRMISYYDHGHTNKGREATQALSTYIAEMFED